MSDEGPSKPSGRPSEEELERIREAYKTADPTRYSKLPPTEPMVETGVVPLKENHIYESEGDTYFELTKRGATQQVVVRMLKGIINVSDVVSLAENVKPRFYSHEMSLDAIAAATSEDESSIDILILKALFGDYDHTRRTSLNSRMKDDRIAYYDFADAAFHDWDTTEDVYQKSWSFFLKKILYPQKLPILSAKLTLLNTRFNGESGREFLKSVCESTGEKVWQLFTLPGKEKYESDGGFEYFYGKLLMKLRVLTEECDAALARSEKAAAE